MAKISSFRELNVYQAAMDAAMEVFELTRRFPACEKFALVDQVGRSSRSVCANIAEAWRKRLEFAQRCDYFTVEQFYDLDGRYDKILAQLVRMISAPGQWTID